MTQEAVVTRTLAGRMAEVAVTRTTACGSNCGNCESCIFQNELKTLAHNKINAQPGQRVLIESSSKKVYGAIMIVYILPIVLLLCGFFIASLAGLSEGMCILCSFIGLLLGGVILVASQRMKKNKAPISFDIVERI